MKRIIAIIFALLLCVSCCACQKNETAEESVSSGAPVFGETQEEEPSEADTEAETTEEETEAEAKIDPDKVMDNFVAKLDAGDYVLDVKGRVRINVYKDSEVDWYYSDEEKISKTCFTLNGETFQAIFSGDELDELMYYSPKSALEVCYNKLLNQWITIADGNMFDVFYNNVDNPLEFTSKDTDVKMTLLSFMGYSDMVLRFMHDIVVTMDAEDPTSVHIAAEVDDDTAGRHYYDDIDITVTFGAAEPDPVVAAWESDPAFPLDPSGWDGDNEAAIGTIFTRDYIDMAVPFPEFASYTLTYDREIMDRSSVLVFTDTHANESDVESYIAQLEKEGFVPKEDGSGYSKLIRPDYHAYSNLEVSYDNGLQLVATLDHDYIFYNSLEEINKVIAGYGFPELSEDAGLSDWIARDEAWARAESWAYFVDYNIYTVVKVQLKDVGTFEQYMKAYGEKLKEKGYEPQERAVPDDEEEEEEEEIPAPSRYYNNNQAQCFWYYTEGYTATLVFDEKKCLTPAEVTGKLKEGGFPELTLPEVYYSKDRQPYYYIISGFEGVYMDVDMFFDTVDEANALLADYSDQLEAAGFEAIDPRSVKSDKDVCYYNPETITFFEFSLYERPSGKAVVSSLFINAE